VRLAHDLSLNGQRPMACQRGRGGFAGLPERENFAGLPERESSAGLPERQKGFCRPAGEGKLYKLRGTMEGEQGYRALKGFR